VRGSRFEVRLTVTPQLSDGGTEIALRSEALAARSGCGGSGGGEGGDGPIVMPVRRGALTLGGTLDRAAGHAGLGGGSEGRAERETPVLRPGMRRLLRSTAFCNVPLLN
jgi:hypothetical protein